MKWGIDEPTPLEVLEQKIKELEDRVHLLEQESVEQSNSMYECLNSIEARIDILTAERLENFNLGGK
jgi:TolA-binding protein